MGQGRGSECIKIEWKEGNKELLALSFYREATCTATSRVVKDI